MKQFCDILGEEITLKEYPDGTKMIDHDEVKRILRVHPNIKTTLVPKTISADLAVFECVAENTATGVKTLAEYGESSSKNLFGQISKEYPVTMAQKRAIDKAVLSLLELDKVEKDRSDIEYTPVHSEMLGTDINAMNCSDDNGNSLLIVSHEEILSIVRNNPIDVSVVPLVMSATNAVFMATALNTETGVSVVEEIGEANATNLHSKIAKQYPISTAYARAVDKSVLSLLGLDKRVYSSMEIDNAKPTSTEDSVPEESFETSTEVIETLPFALEETPEKVAEVESVSPITELPFAEEPTIVGETVEEIVEIEPVKEEVEVMIAEPFKDDEVLKIGNCNGLTYGEVKGTKRFDLLVGKMKLTKDNYYPDEERTAQLLAIKKYARSLAERKVA